MSRKSVPQEFPTRVTQKSVPQECHLDICSFSNVLAFGLVGSILFCRLGLMCRRQSVTVWDWLRPSKAANCAKRGATCFFPHCVPHCEPKWASCGSCRNDRSVFFWLAHPPFWDGRIDSFRRLKAFGSCTCSGQVCHTRRKITILTLGSWRNLPLLRLRHGPLVQCHESWIIE